MLAIVAPGQGAQKSGFLSPWLEIDSAARLLGELAEVSGLDLVRYGTEADDETIRDTAIAQPLLVAASIVAARELFATSGSTAADVGAVAGHSVGEFAAAVVAGVLGDADALVLVRERGQAMAEAAAVRPTSMTAVVAGDPEEVLAKIAAAGLTAANNNGAGQIVAAGTLEQLQALTDDPPTRARLIPLSVAGAFHTVHMAPAVERLAAVAADVSVTEPVTTLLSNADGAAVAGGRDAVNRMVGQIAHPVRWDLCMATLADLGVTGLLELAPAGTLTGIARRNLKGVELFNLNTPDQLGGAAEFVAQHRSIPVR